MRVTIALATVLAMTASCDSDPAPCAQTCAGCCNGETCLKGTNVSACGSGGGKCVDCFAAKLVCSAERVCEGAGTGPGSCASSCAGCCDGTACLPGTNDYKCGTGGQKCADCRSQGLFCSAAGGCAASGAGGGGGTSGAGGGTGAAMLFVTFRYDYIKSVSGTCPLYVFEQAVCSQIRTMTLAQFQALRLEYPNCTTTQQSTDGYTINCGGSCYSQGQACPQGGYSQRVCPAPKYASMVACLWEPP